MTEAHKPGRQAHAPRHLARVFALLGFYQWIADPTLKAQKIEENLPALLADDEEGTPVEDLGLTSEDWARCDRELLTTLLSGAIGEHAALEAEFSPFVDRDLKRVSLVERAILFIGTYELLRCLGEIRHGRQRLTADMLLQRSALRRWATCRPEWG